MAAEKFIQHDTLGGLREIQAAVTGGAGDADKIASLDVNGRFPLAMMPTGLSPDTAILTASGALAAGDFVNVYDNAGTPSVRKADASAVGTKAHGFVLDAFADTVAATVYFEGSNTAVTGQTVGDVFLSTTAGAPTTTAPVGSTEIVQRIGVAVSATQINFEPAAPIELV